MCLVVVAGSAENFAVLQHRLATKGVGDYVVVVDAPDLQRQRTRLTAALGPLISGHLDAG
jgi:hypothetical protein